MLGARIGSEGHGPAKGRCRGLGDRCEGHFRAHGPRQGSLCEGGLGRGVGRAACGTAGGSIHQVGLRDAFPFLRDAKRNVISESTVIAVEKKCVLYCK